MTRIGNAELLQDEGVFASEVSLLPEPLPPEASQPVERLDRKPSIFDERMSDRLGHAVVALVQTAPSIPKAIIMGHGREMFGAVRQAL